MVILVVGSTGFVGAQIALKLQQAGHSVRALVRGGAQNPKAQLLIASKIHALDGDLTLPDTLLSACAGADAVVTTATCGAGGAGEGTERVDRQGGLALIAAAERQGVRRFVYTSYSGNIVEESPLTTAKRDCETRLLAGSIEAVILRPSYFMEMWLSPALGFDPQAGTARIYGSGEAGVSYISAFDVADFAAAAVTKSYLYKSVVLEMGGPEPLSQLDAVFLFEQALGKEIKTEHVSVETLEAQHKSHDPREKTFAALMLRYARGDVILDAVKNAEAHGIRLSSVAEYASSFRARAASTNP